MKRILVTGASGSLGRWVIKYLLSEGKYEITALDLKNKESLHYLKKYHKRINIIYGNIEDPNLIDALIKEHDFVIHLAGCLPPLCNLSPIFGEKLDYKGTENIVRSISFYNPECFMIYPSTTTLYKTSEQAITSSSKVEYDKEDYFSATKYACEKLIQKKLPNYVILRMPFVLEDEFPKQMIHLYKENELVEWITSRDAAYGMVKCIEHKTDINKKIKILSGGASCRINSTELAIYLLDTCGYKHHEIQDTIFNPYKYNGHIFKEDKKMNELLHYQNDTIESYKMRLKKNNKHHYIARLLAKPQKIRLERKRKKWLA